MKKVLAVGIFDGVHAGHQQIIDVAKHQGEVTIVTFDPHPTSVFAPERTPTQLVTLKDRVNLLKQAGASFVEVINFNKEFSLLSPDEFIEDILVGRFAAEHVVIGQYIDQLDELSEVLGAPLIKGETPIKEREILFNKFRSGEIKCLVVSKVANFSIDLPDATIAIQVSGAFGSRQEEAQRLGRILRPKSDGRGAKFYSVISRDTIDQDFAQNRQRFLAEQGYSYKIIDADDVFQGKI